MSRRRFIPELFDRRPLSRMKVPRGAQNCQHADASERTRAEGGTAAGGLMKGGVNLRFV